MAHSGGPAAVCVTQHHNLMTAGREFGRMDRSVIGFGATVGKKRFLQATRSDLRQLLREIRLRLVAVKRRRMRDALDLINDRVGYYRVGVAHADRQHTAKAVEIFVAAIVPNVKALAAHERQRLLVIRRNCGEEKLFVFANSFGLRSLWLW